MGGKKSTFCNSVNTLKTSRLTLLSFFAAATSTFGQVTVERTCRILFPDRPLGAPQELYLFDGISSQKVELPGKNLSPIYKLPPGILTLYLLPAPADDPKTVSPAAPSVALTEAHTDFYLIVSSDPENKIAPVSISVVDANGALFGSGQMLWINQTDKTITGNLGSEKITLKPNSREVIKEPRNGTGNYPVNLNFLIEGNDFVHPLCETQWNHTPQNRVIVFVIPEKKRRAPRVFAFPDFRQH